MGMDGAARRRQIVAALEGSARPLSGKELSDMLRVSRQVIVQDIALLRHEGHEIVGLHAGYVLREERKGLRRLIKCHHTDDQLEDEMDIVVDAGATMEDVIVNHRTYGVISAPLGARSRRDVQGFLEGIHSGVSSPLMLLTDGYHFHHISAPSEDILDAVEEKLKDRGYLVPIETWERDDIERHTKR